MKALKQIFIGNNGTWVGFALMLSKVSGLLVTMAVARVLSAEELGTVISALNFLNFFIPLVGLGSYQGALRYGSLSQDQSEQQNIFRYSFYYGFFAQFVITAIMFLLAYFFIKDLGVLQLVLLFSVRFFGFFLLDQAKAEARASGNNKKFSLIEIGFSTASILLGVVCTYFFGLEGYLFSLCVSPFVVLFFHSFRLRNAPIKTDIKTFWNYNLFTGFTLQIWQWIFILDVFIIGYFFTSQEVSFYKISSMIPFNLLFISQIIMQTEYPNFCKHQNDKSYFIVFLKHYYLWMLAVSVIILIVAFGMPGFIMKLFGKNYTNPEIFKILIWGSISSLFFRIPFGNLLAARGLSKHNLATATLSLVLLVLFSFLFVNRFGLKSIAYASVIALTVSGIISAVLFYGSFREKKISNV